MAEALFLIIGLTIGSLSVFFILKGKIDKTKSLENKIFEITEQVDDYRQKKETFETKATVAENLLIEEKNQNSKLENQISKNNLDLIELNKQLSSMVTENKNLEEKLSTQKEDLEQLNKKFTSEFENIANKLFEKSSEKINKQGSEQLDQILKPFKDRLNELKTQIYDTYEKDTKQRIRLHEQVKQLFDLNQQISADAQNLTNALKSNSKVQGDWGEEILENILQHSGLRKGYEYDTQSSFTSNEGHVLRPDMIVHYPDNRDIIIDSKVSLTDYERFVSADNPLEKEQYLKAHIQSIKQHIKELSEKNYQDIYQIETLDFVMMFVPIEGAYYIAVEEDRTLWQWSYEKKILLINPTNLITALKMISNLWQQDYQNKNVMEIARQSGGLYDSFVLLLEDFSKLEKKFDDVQSIFTNLQKRVSTGKGNLITRVENIKKLGAKTKKNMPDAYLDAINE